MIRAVANVIRGEGIASSVRRASERAYEALHPFASATGAEILNVAPGGIAARSGGIAVQLRARLRAERTMREVALSRDVRGARAIHLEGTSGIALDEVLRWIDSGVRVVVSVHDFSLFCARPHLIELPMERFCFYSRDLDRCERCLRQTWDVTRDAQLARRTQARRILESATGVIFASRFLLEQHRELFAPRAMNAAVVEPALDGEVVQTSGRGVAFAGSVQVHKGAHLLPDIARGRELHVFGGGDVTLLRALRRHPNLVIHGYYRAGTLPSLLARHDIGLVVLPSIWPEAFCLAMSEAWLAGASVAAFDLGAPAQRIREHGGGFLAPLDSGADGLAEIVERWREAPSALAPRVMRTPMDAAREHLALYRAWGLLS
ncbi:MAG TPA: glycosyltransferase [Thermoanaerobaculia bacterium]|nr:glycosyltransferase [Thermoanaerobaculia bacterium]